MKTYATPLLFDPNTSPGKYKNQLDYWLTPYITPQTSGSSLTIFSYENIRRAQITVSGVLEDSCYIKVYFNNKLIFSAEKDEGNVNHTIDNISDGTIIIEYALTMDASNATDRGARYYISVVSNKHPLKRLTCTSVINRMLDLAEPLLMGQKPRFKLNEEQAELFDQIPCPELTCTKQTLRECLQEGGKIVHGEPRLKTLEDGTMEISYDLYGSNETSSLGRNRYRCINRTMRQVVNNYCSSIDSSAENLVNQLNWAQGVITEPYAGGFKTVRTDTQYVRISEDNMIIATDRPIYKVVKLECGIVPNNGGNIDYADITAYVFESTLYGSQLSSYNGNYPYSKAYGLYYTQGQKNIQGLNFKEPKAIFPAFERYAIINILESATGKTVRTLDTEFYPQLAFRVTYVPYFNVRVGQSKSYYKEYETPAVLAYNQQANVIETRYYGENLKGVVARLGNVEKTYTYVFARFSQVPKAGDMFDENYYISTVSTEVYPTYIKCTVGLSKDFNRLSQYIGISSNRRYYEVSERAAYDRSVLYKEYIVVGDKEPRDERSLIGWNFKGGLRAIFQRDGYQDNSLYNRLTSVNAWGGTYNNPTSTTVNGIEVSPLPVAVLPVTACALGNSMVFVWSYADNYSAGATVTYMENGDVKGYFQDDYQYTDYYGRIYYYNFDLRLSGEVPDNFEEQTELGLTLPKGEFLPAIGKKSDEYISTMGVAPYILRKDNREILQFNVQVEFVTNREGLIIGSALAAECPFVSGTKDGNKPVLYALKEPLNKFTSSMAGGGINIKPILYGRRLNQVGGTESEESDGTDIAWNTNYNTTTQGILVKPGATYSFSFPVWRVVLKSKNNLQNGADYIGYKGGDHNVESKVSEITIPTNNGSSVYMFLTATETTNGRTTTVNDLEIKETLDGKTRVIQKPTIAKEMTYTVGVDSAEENNPYIELSEFPEDCKAFAMVSYPTYTTETVEDEYGNVSQQTSVSGGDLLFGANGNFKAGEKYPVVWFSNKHDIYKK